MKKINILFTSSGRRVELIKSFKRSLYKLNLSGNIIVADNNYYISTAQIADIYEPVPRIQAPNYISRLQEICQKHEVKLLIPLIDTELYQLSVERESFAKLGVTVLVSSSETNEICLNKRKTAAFFRQIGLETPKIIEAEDILAAPHPQYPYLIKPVNGSCSINVTKINNAKELSFFKDYIPNAIVQEYIMGKEYTLDILVDFQGRVRCIVPRLRIATRAGEISKGMTVKNKKIMTAAQKVVSALPGACGCITLQCFQLDNDRIIFIEINPRFGGGIPLSIKAGADYPTWIIQMLLKQEVKIAIDQWQENLIMLRYDDSVFLEGGCQVVEQNSPRH